MASRGGAFVVVLIMVLCSLLPVMPLQAAACENTKPSRLVPAMFVFGDSLVDVGNNNHLPNVNDSCKANYPPYGVDYPSHSPTGRFSNGYNLADQLAQQLGFAESPPPFLSLTKNETARRFSRLTSTGGINFASGGSGLQPTTGGSNVCGGQVFSMAEQVGNFTSLVRTWGSKKRKQKRAAADLISNSLVFISVGSNDLFEYSDFFADPMHHNFTRNDTVFLNQLIHLYATYVRDLYGAGATKFSVVSPSLIGCCPSQRRIANQSNDKDISGCLATANTLSMLLYPMIDSMLQNLSRNELPGMKYSLGDAIGMARYILGHATTPPNNFRTTDRACCDDSSSAEDSAGGTGCNASVRPCRDRNSFFFWDRYHPTQAVSAVTANQLFRGNQTYVHPVNVQQLVAAAASRRP